VVAHFLPEWIQQAPASTLRRHPSHPPSSWPSHTRQAEYVTLCAAAAAAGVAIDVHGQVSLPKLLDVDWRVDVKTSANTVSRMAAPTALVQLTVRGPPVRRAATPTPPKNGVVRSSSSPQSWHMWERSWLLIRWSQVAQPSVQDGVVGAMDSVNFEVNKETLQTMLDGLGKIRDQLSAV
jgi:hypothetical protein